ncbi:hypothetical protein B296_00039695 [Ensete ventricosum]|uniref:Uncharacterized protein n=1 Tax=Ensete ventricosum TaxID=4639 RepID=A0A426X3W1_ENSVE|nr:hypothetical protein B296_00039695 [Ensete ventricosum]
MILGACQDGVRKFARRRPRLVERLSRVAEKLVGMGFRLEFARRFAEGIGKLDRNTSGDHRGEDQNTYRKNAEGYRIGRS